MAKEYADGYLDDLVVEAKSQEAANLNNEGVEAQVAYIEKVYGPDWDITKETAEEKE